MERIIVAALVLTSIAEAQTSMAAVDQYLMADRNAEIVLARSAAPKSVSDDAGVMVLDRQGYQTAVKGTNGFVCMVLRSWTAGPDEAEFWNPKIRAPICFNPTAVRTYVPLMTLRARLLFSGKSKDQMVAAIKTGLDKKELPAQEIGAMCYMMSKDGHLNDRAGHWHPHLMFFVPLADAKAWGADVPGSPVLSAADPVDRLTIFMVPVAKWSDGTADAH